MGCLAPTYAQRFDIQVFEKGRHARMALEKWLATAMALSWQFTLLGYSMFGLRTDWLLEGAYGQKARKSSTLSR